MNQDIQLAIDNNDFEKLKESLNLSTIITPKIYEIIIKNDAFSIITMFKENDTVLFLDILSFLSYEGELKLFKKTIETFGIRDLSFNHYDCFRRAVSGESEEMTLYILDNFFIKVYSNNSEALFECVLEENFSLFKLIFEHKKCILSNQSIIELSEFCWKQNKDFASIVLQHEQFGRIINSPLKEKVNKEILNVYDNFIKIANF